MGDKIITKERAFEEGRAAHEARKPRVAPKGYLSTPGLRKKWHEGWDSIEVRVPKMVTRIDQSPSLAESLPEGSPVPEVYIQPRPTACISCRAIRMVHGHQAVLVTNLVGGFAYMWCRGCGHRFKLRIQ